ncbi:hypothetical protein AWM79_16065 [Pseudomonas agarici]|uniref:Uncharacterized protein n=1 Tax=Pseudomonas agarici TaxID=46677 RepID=A0A0X1T3T5_PSEAA|nr:hypothetical protein [Pseudomonas agarici]AMB86734.1 hypothetical protein AWM79_16065 [Pseudomonas agarici]NWB93940.1 hypothetical protein [Pseudomonas agarici]NWC11436.1 hypothetical protein [Pseudomonas agarici]SEL69829.1 hypothetical protein SAMN05216604_12813 [Pseudomonas agarici]
MWGDELRGWIGLFGDANLSIQTMSAQPGVITLSSVLANPLDRRSSSDGPGLLPATVSAP